VANKPIRGAEKIVETDTEANLLYDFVGIFGVYVVFDSFTTRLLEVVGSDLDEI
jgi:hypothetical protein